MNTPPVTLDELIERAAIVEEGEQVSRQKAEDLADKMHGFPTWDRAMKALKNGAA